MSKNLKKIMVTGAALLMFTSVGAEASNVNVSARHVHSHRITKVNHQRKNKRNNRKFTNRKHTHRNNRRVHKSQRRNKHFNKKQRTTNNHKQQTKQLAKRAINKKRQNSRHTKKNSRIIKSKFRRSNNQHLLKRSGFYDLRAYGPDIMSKYAPNNRKAVIPNNVNVKDVLWLKGHFLQKKPAVYQYKTAKHGWIHL